MTIKNKKQGILCGGGPGAGAEILWEGRLGVGKGGVGGRVWGGRGWG